MTPTLTQFFLKFQNEAVLVGKNWAPEHAYPGVCDVM